MANMGDRRARLRDATGRTPGIEVQTSRRRSPLSATDRSDLKHRPVALGLGQALRPSPRRKARNGRGRKRLPGPPNA